MHPEPVFVIHLRSSGIDSQPGRPVRQPYLSSAMLNMLAESIPELHKRLQIPALVGRYDIPIPSRFLVLTDCSKIPAQISVENLEL